MVSKANLWGWGMNGQGRIMIRLWRLQDNPTFLMGSKTLQGFRITRISEEAGPCSLRSLDKIMAVWVDLGGAAGACGQGLVLFEEGFSESQHPGKLSVIQ